MFHWLFEDGDWFAPKRYGYGADLPIAWQGWAVLGIYLAIAIAPGVAAIFLGPIALGVGLVALLLGTWALIVITRKHTRGGWRWRWGEKD
ncbi:MAG: hypothetical protein P0Y56_09675 [Candidatus Andeanibacterium colombiense]|uniref:Uncharacterized protein n=1 Tax=Candidatus Andeanibacterium colombiense TaxID=3121345 RepID=A0AAJ5X785_9SPHN|nr:MAG: hypothetical protein P0Y56_09675 [Sphingomonadaceae bacterium]